MKGFGTDEKTIIKVRMASRKWWPADCERVASTPQAHHSLAQELTSITNAQRQEVTLKYKTMLGRDLIDDLKSGACVCVCVCVCVCGPALPLGAGPQPLGST